MDIGAQKIIILWLSLAILNIGVFVLLQFSLRTINVKDVLREKSPKTFLPRLSVATGRDGVDAQPSPDLTSYSRVAGLIGAIVMACFLWAISNAVIFDALCAPGDVTSLLNSMGKYFLAGASLFAPYAVNKLSGIGT
jgi:hypothetical protein